MASNIHVVPHDGEWAIRREGSNRVSSIHGTQAEATQQAEVTGRRDQVEVLIHGRNGRIRERNTYGKDPYPPKG